MSPKSRDVTPARRLLDALGPLPAGPERPASDFGQPARMAMGELLEPDAIAGPESRLGPLEKVHVFWFAGLSCDGCSVSVTGAQSPSVESLVMGAIPGLPRLVLHHPVLNLESGPAYLQAHQDALAGRLDAPYVVVVEGSLGDETVPLSLGGYWAGQGELPWGAGGAPRTVTAEEWVARMAPNAAATIAIGTCATWGGIPAGYGNPTGAMGLMDFLGADYRSTAGLPVVNVPGCAPIGDNFTETAAALLYFLQGFGPLPEFDELGRPAWLYGETVHSQCGRASSFDADHGPEFGGSDCLVSVGCWGPAVLCNMSSRGAINHAGGCISAGGACIGCTMPGFPDKFAPFAREAPAGRLEGGRTDLDREPRWDRQGEVPTGWIQVKLTVPGARRGVATGGRRTDTAKKPAGRRRQQQQAAETSAAL